MRRAFGDNLTKFLDSVLIVKTSILTPRHLLAVVNRDCERGESAACSERSAMPFRLDALKSEGMRSSRFDDLRQPLVMRRHEVVALGRKSNLTLVVELP